MKKILLILSALLLTWIGANAQTEAGDVVHSCVADGVDWQKPDHWTASNDATTNLHINTHSTEADPSGMVTPFVEYWYASGTNLPDDVLSHDQLSNLEAGYYSVSIDVRAFNESGTTAINSNCTLLYANSVYADITTLTSTTEFSSHYELYGTLNLLVQLTEEDNGSLDIHFTVSNANYNWLAFKNLTVTYLGEDPTLSYVTGYMNAEVEAAMKAAVDAWNESDYSSLSLFEAAEDAIQAAEASAEQYAEIAELVAKLDEAGLAVWETTTTASKYEAKTLETSEDFGEDMATAQAAQKDEGTDWSCVARYTGDWTGNTGTIYADGAAVAERYGDEITGGSTSNPNKVIYKTLTGLPAGTYTISFYAEANNAWVGAAEGDGIAQVFANNKAQDITVGDYTTIGGGSTHSWLDDDLYTLECNVINGTLEFGLQNIATGGNWYTVMPSNLYLDAFIDAPVIGDASANKTAVVPGDEITITFEVAVPDNNEEYTLVGSDFTDETSGIAVSYAEDATFTFTVPDDVSGSFSVTIPAGQLYYTLDNETIVSSEEQTIEFTVSVFADQYGVYLYNTHSDQFLSRGGETSGDPTTYGEIAATDVYGIPLDITFGDDGFATVKFLDSNNYLYLEGWAYTDGTQANAAKYEVRTVTTTDGETVYQFCYNGNDEYLYVNDETNNYVASNGNLGDNGGDNNMNSQPERGYWQIFSADERNAHKAARELNDHIAIAAAAGETVTSEAEFEAYLESIGTTTDVTDMVANAALTNLSGWTSTTYSGSSINTGTYGTEFYVTDAKISQTVTGLEQGIYKVTMQGFVRQGGSSNIITNNLGVYDLSIGFIEANGYQTNIMPWAEDREKMSSETSYGDTYPSNTTQAAACFTAGLYNNELYTYVGEDGSLELSINCPDALGSGWMIVYNLTLTYYGEIVELDYANDVTWKLANPSFEVDNVVANLTVDTTRGPEDGGAWTVTSLTGWDLVVPDNEWSFHDIMTKDATATDNNFGAPGTPSDGTYMLYLRDGNSTVTASVEQTITLPVGEYKLTVDTKCVSTSNSTGALVAKVGDETIKSTAVALHSSYVNGEESLEWDAAVLTLSLDTETDVTVGVDVSFNGNGSFLLDNFKLYSVEEITKSIEWTMTDAGWGTMILPFAATLADGLTAYSCDGTTTDEENETTTVNLTEVGQNIAANTPYIIECTDDSAIKEHTFTGTPTNEKETYTEGILTGTLVDLAVAKGAAFATDGTMYLLQNHVDESGEGEGLAFYPIIAATDTEDNSKDATLDAYHCYLTLDDSSNPSGARLYIGFPDSGEATAIVAVESENLANDAIYDLSGRRVSKAVKGVYIQNGKKVLVK